MNDRQGGGPKFDGSEGDGEQSVGHQRAVGDAAG